MSTAPQISTYSMWSLFRNCRKACEYRYVLGLVPNQKDANLSFGSLIHECLQTWHGTGDLNAVLAYIDGACGNRTSDEGVRRDWHLARAMMTGYASRYPQEDFTVVALEKTFEGSIVNPATGAAPAVSTSPARWMGSSGSVVSTTFSNTKRRPRSAPTIWSDSGPTSRSPFIPITSRRRWACPSRG